MTTKLGRVRFALTSAAAAGLLTANLGAQPMSRNASQPDRSTPTPSSGSTDEPKNSISVLAGQFIYDRGGDAPYAYASVRVGRRFARYVEGEFGAGYARISTKLYSLTPTVTTYNVSTPLVTSDATLHLIFPIRRFTPYVGVSGGFFRRSGSAAYDNLQVSGSSLGLVGGGKFFLSNGLGVRAEFRYRSDKHNGFETRANDFEQSAGLIYRF